MIIDDQGRALLTQRRDNGHREAPGGVLERGEDIRSGLLRELPEETGLDVAPVVLTGVYKHMTRGIVALAFRCKAVGGRPTETKEAHAHRWVTADEVQKLASKRSPSASGVESVFGGVLPHQRPRAAYPASDPVTAFPRAGLSSIHANSRHCPCS